MEKPSRSSALLILLFGTFAIIGVACNTETQKSNSTANIQPTAVAASPAAKRPTSPKFNSPTKNLTTRQIDTYELALDKAASALNISQSAQSPDDWKLAISRWQEAIRLLKAMPASSPNQAKAKTKLAEYQKNLADAKRKAIPPKPVPVVAANPGFPINPTTPLVEESSSSSVVRVPIKYRLAGTPVIEVTFNGSQRYDMVLDTGASGIVITTQMANALGVRPQGKVIASTPSDRAQEFDLGYIDSVAVGTLVVPGLRVAIAPALKVGLLGQEFFRNYDVTIKRDTIEFHPH